LRMTIFIPRPAPASMPDSASPTSRA
jgi:hypothetical protein